MGLTPIRVGQLNSYIGRVLKTDPLLSDVSVIGEISNLNFHNSGHIYFSLKDETSTIRVFLGRWAAPQISCPLEEGMEVIASGSVSVYERGGSYSLNVRALEPAGQGQLAIRFQQLKEKLSREGLFDPAHKKELPSFPRIVAVVTSETGAAIQDILKIIRSRNNVVKILICPVLVQGPSAPADIASAIDWLNREHPEADVIIAGRGGGSMEDLWAFNEEIVARSIYRSTIPVISAVGHETDTTIADFVADVRAETPTAAAALVVPDTNELRQYLEYYRDEMTQNLLRRTQFARQRLEAASPQSSAMGIRTRIGYEQMHLDHLMETMSNQLREKIRTEEQRITLLRQVIEAGNPFDILRRGYSVVTDGQGSILRSVQGLAPGSTVSIRMSDGTADAQVSAIREGELK